MRRGIPILIILFFIQIVSAESFLRGDANNDGFIDISDAVFILSYLFQGNVQPTCLDAVDVDDSGTIEITDAVYFLTFLFLDGDKPPAPYPSKGEDATLDALSCGREDIVAVTSDSTYKYNLRVISERLVWSSFRGSGGYDLYSCRWEDNGKEGGCLRNDLKLYFGSNIIFIDNDFFYTGDGYKCPLNAEGFFCSTSERFISDNNIYRIFDIEDNIAYYLAYINSDAFSGYAIFSCDIYKGSDEGGCFSDSISFIPLPEGNIISFDLNQKIITFSTIANQGWNLYACKVDGDMPSERCSASLTKVAELRNFIAPKTNGDLIVWHQFVGDNPEIFYCSFSKTGSPGGCGLDDEKIRVTNSLELQSFPLIDDSILAWEDWNGEKRIISFCDFNLNGKEGGCLEHDNKKSIEFESDVFSHLPFDKKIFFVKREGDFTTIYSYAMS